MVVPGAQRLAPTQEACLLLLMIIKLVCVVVPFQDIQGLIYNVDINLDNAFKNLEKWDDKISKLPDRNKIFLLEKQK